MSLQVSLMLSQRKILNLKNWVTAIYWHHLRISPKKKWMKSQVITIQFLLQPKKIHPSWKISMSHANLRAIETSRNGISLRWGKPWATLKLRKNLHSRMILLTKSSTMGLMDLREEIQFFSTLRKRRDLQVRSQRRRNLRSPKDS